jgi:hypothetical protein
LDGDKCHHGLVHWKSCAAFERSQAWTKVEKDQNQALLGVKISCKFQSLFFLAKDTCNFMFRAIPDANQSDDRITFPGFADFFLNAVRRTPTIS